MIIGAIMRTVRLRRLLNIAAPLRPDRGCLGMDFVGRVVAGRTRNGTPGSQKEDLSLHYSFEITKEFVRMSRLCRAHAQSAAVEAASSVRLSEVRRNRCP